MVSSPHHSASQALIGDGPKASSSFDQISISAKYPRFLVIAPVPEISVKSNEKYTIRIRRAWCMSVGIPVLIVLEKH